jgi:hypothetical protein
MTEAEWLTGNEPEAMWEHCKREVRNARRTRLLAVACCRLVWDSLDLWYRDVVEVAERYADGQASRADFRRLGYPAIGGPPSDVEVVVGQARADDAWIDERYFVECFANLYSPMAVGVAFDVVVGLVRDIFGNPFHPVTFPSEWRTDTAVTLARQMYESRDFSAMPILADALQDAGCDNEDILNHCRQPGPHVRGCWVVDLVLGMERSG